MTKYKEILRLHSLGLNNTRISESCGCSRTTVIRALQRANDCKISWHENLFESARADAVCDRLSNSSYIIKLEGDSMRKRKGIGI